MKTTLLFLAAFSLALPACQNTTPRQEAAATAAGLAALNTVVKAYAAGDKVDGKVAAQAAAAALQASSDVLATPEPEAQAKAKTAAVVTP